MKQARSFTISKDILEAIADTKGSVSASERVNELLRRALELEQRERLEQEAAEFFTKKKDEHSTRERAAFQKASKQSLSRG